MTRVAEEDGWAVDDPVLRLRIRGTETAFELPMEAPGTTLVVGAAEDCDLRLDDPTGCVSRRHAHLVHERSGWMLLDRASMNGIRQDGERRQSIELRPGVEIEIGGVTLIAESLRLQALRAFLLRILGWDEVQLAAVDRGLQAVRAMATRRAALVLCGAGELCGIARQLHDLALGGERPFVVCDGNAAVAIEPSSRATYCFEDDTLPDDFATLASTVTAAASKARLVVCSPSRDDATEAMAQLALSAVLDLPDLATRARDLEQLILAYAADAVATLGAPGHGFREHEMNWLRELALATLDEVKDTTYRLVALRNWGVRGGAQRLGITHVALSRWSSRRHIPT